MIHLTHKYPKLVPLARNNLHVATFLKAIHMHIANELTVEMLIKELVEHNNKLMEMTDGKHCE